jgi:hypothetical protein
MALQIEFDVVEAPSNQEIWVYDTTGVYHSVNNPTGWGGVNPNFTDVTSSIITVTMPDSKTLQPSTDPALTFVLNASPLPNVIGDKLVLFQTSLGLLSTDEFIDGEYQFEVIMSGVFSSAPFSFSWKTRFVFFNKLTCCAQKRMADADLADCGCAPCREKLFNILLLDLAVRGVASNNDCGKPNKALEILKVATGMCNNDNCQGCN